MAMNGTIYDLSGIADVFNRTDTELVFSLAKGLKPGKNTEVLVQLHAVFIGFSRGKPYAVNSYGDLALYTKGNSSFHASSFPAGVPHKKLDDPYVWLDGKIISQEKKKTAVDIGGSSYKRSSLYGNYSYYDEAEYYNRLGADDGKVETVWDTTVCDYVEMQESTIYKRADMTKDTNRCCWKVVKVAANKIFMVRYLAQPILGGVFMPLVIVAQMSYSNSYKLLKGLCPTSTTTFVRARIDEKIKNEASEVLETMGLTVSDVVVSR